MQARFLTLFITTAALVMACGGGSAGPGSAAATATLETAPSKPATPVVAPPTAATTPLPPSDLKIIEFPVPRGSAPHDVAPAADGRVWYTAQGAGALGVLDPATGEVVQVPL